MGLFTHIACSPGVPEAGRLEVLRVEVRDDSWQFGLDSRVNFG